MSEYAARSWLDLHKGDIPAFDVHKRQAIDILENPHKRLADLADVLALDPGMSVSLYQQANGRQRSKDKPMVESVEDALAVLGSSTVNDLVRQHKTVNESISNKAVRQAYHQLMSRMYYLLALVDEFISIQGIRRVGETRSAALLHNIGEVYACLFDFGQYQKYQAKFDLLGADVNSARPVFGFGFRELSREICRKMHLPPLVIESLDNAFTADRRVRVIQFAADISHQAETGWNHSAMRATQDVCAKYLNQSIDRFETLVEQTAIASARNCPITGVLPAAARLIMLPEVKASGIPGSARRAATAVGSAKAVPAQSLSADKNFLARLKNLAESPDVAAEQIVDLLLEHLEKGLHMSRVLLLALSQDRVMLGARASRGIKPYSLLNKLMINTNENRMFRSLLAKPLGLWVSPANYAQYEDFLPVSFKNSALNEDFFLMTLFSGASPVGMIFCDREQSVNDLDKEAYRRFKGAIRLTSIELGRRTTGPG